MPTYHFSCGCGWQDDKRAGFDDYVIPCPACQSPASRASVYSINVSGFARTPESQRDHREDYRRFKEATAELEYKHEKMKDATQNPNLRPPPIYQTAKARAVDLASKGATVDDL